MQKIIKPSTVIGHLDTMAMAERAFALKKISGYRNAMDIKMNIIDPIINYINYFNHLDKYDRRVLGLDFQEIKILNEFVDFLQPASVQYDPADQECAELLCKDEVDVKTEVLKVRTNSKGDKEYYTENVDWTFDTEGVNYEDYLNACSKFRGLFKDNLDNNTTTLDTVRKFVSWSDVESKAVYDMEDELDDNNVLHMVRFNDGRPFIPLHVKSFLSLGWKARHFNAELSELLEDYVEKWLI